MPPKPRPRELLFVIHGGRADNPALRHLVSWVRDKGHTVHPRVTWEPGDATRFTREGIERGVDTVVAVGGDGTVNEVINGLDGSDIALGIVPLGTANDFARQVGIPDDPDHAMDVVLQREPMRIDTGELNGRRFLNVSSGGIGAEATAETPAEAKETLGPVAYALTGIRLLGELAPYRACFSGKDFAVETECLLFAVGNARATGGGMRITPVADVTDGLLDVCVIEAMPLVDFARVVLKVRRGEHLEERGVHYAQVGALEVSADRAVTVNVDGEPTVTRTLHYRARAGDLRIHLPHLPGVEEEEG